MDAESFTRAIQERDAQITRLREYAKALEAALAEKRGEEAKDAAYRSTWDQEIQQLRYEHGLRVDLTLR